MTFSLLIAQLINGLQTGSVYALVALGYSMVYGIIKLLNFAHGDIIMVGAYSVYSTLLLMNQPILAILFAIVICVVLGITIEKIAYRPLRGASPLAVLITAIGVSYFLQAIAQLIFGARTVPVTVYHFDTVSLGSVATLNLGTLLTLGIGAVIMAGLTLFIKFSRVGRAMIAVSEDRAAAQLMGVNVNRIITLTFAIGSSLAAVASVFYLLQIPSTSPTLGSMPGIKAFTAAVIGGIGSIPGAMIGGILLGVVEKLCQSVEVLSPYTTAIEFGILILILLVKPSGLLGRKRREKV